ncbi:MAG: DUF4920 domain-containing protein [Longimicrobiales bacterium]
MRRPRNVVFVLTVLAACQSAPAFEGDPYGAELTLTEVTEVSSILADPSAWVGQRVLIRGEVKEVCAKKGCWMDIAHPEGLIQVKVADDVIVFPMTARGRTAVVEGTVEALELFAEDAFAAAAHRAEEQGEAFDSTAVFAPTTTYRIQGIGAILLD